MGVFSSFTLTNTITDKFFKIFLKDLKMSYIRTTSLKIKPIDVKPGKLLWMGLRLFMIVCFVQLMSHLCFRSIVRHSIFLTQVFEEGLQRRTRVPDLAWMTQYALIPTTSSALPYHSGATLVPYVGKNPEIHRLLSIPSCLPSSVVMFCW